MGACLFGLETEYAVGGVSRQGRRLPPRDLITPLMGAARSSLTHLQDSGGGLFLANGGRLYADCGAHPEFCTPECLDPWDAVRYVRAGERILHALVERMRSADQDKGDVWLLRTNVDYAAIPSTWGCHESYLCRRHSPDLARHMIPHLVSRIVFTGAGGFNPRSPGIEFTLSPRAGYFERSVSAESTGDRGIFHTRNEPLATGYHRVHVTCGDTLCSDLAAWLKVGTTALVVAMIDGGVDPGAGVQFARPADALRAFAADPDCQAEAEIEIGRRMSAVAVQRHYLALASGHLAAPFMPWWAPEVIRVWGDMLDRLERRDPSLHTTLDWAIKRALFAGFVKSRQLRWASLRDWSPALARLQEPVESPRLPVSARLRLDQQHPAHIAAQEAVRLARRKGLDPDRLDEVHALRQQLFELDTKFGRIGDAGIFSTLDRRAGTLTHRLVAVGRTVEDAMDRPPVSGRAHVRGDAIRRLAGMDGCGAYWDAVWDCADRTLDLSDPFVGVEHWMNPGEWAGRSRDATFARPHPSGGRG